MFSQSAYQGATDSGRRRYDVPGASLRGPYKLWIPKPDNRHSESETEGPRPFSSSHRSHGYHGTTHVAAGNNPATYTSNERPVNPTASTRHVAPPLQKQRSERAPQGYSSEASIHAPVNSSKTSSFNLFKPHVKEPKREDLSKTITASIAVPGRHVASKPVAVPPKSTRHAQLLASSGSLSTQSSTDPSPRTSTDSDPRSGHVSAPAAEYSEARKQSRPSRNAYADARIDRTPMTRRSETTSTQQRRDDKRSKDKEDIVAKVTEALNSGSTGKAKAVESAFPHNQVHPVKRDEAGYVRQTTSSSAFRSAESQVQLHTQSQVPPNLRRYKPTPQSTPFHSVTHLPENVEKNTGRFLSIRGNVEIPSRPHGPPDPPPKPSSSNSKVPMSPSSKIPHQRTASSPWPFNQALPPEPVMPPIKSPTQSSSWKQPFTRLHGSSAAQKVMDTSRKDATTHQSHAPSADSECNSQQDLAPYPELRKQSSRSSLLHGNQPSSHVALTPAPPHSVSVPAPPIAVQTRVNASYVTTSFEPLHWSPNSVPPERPAPGPGGGQQPQVLSQVSSVIPKQVEASHASSLAPKPTPTSSNGKRHPIGGVPSDSTSLSPPAVPQKLDTPSAGLIPSHITPRNASPAMSNSLENKHALPVATEPAPVIDSPYPINNIPSTSIHATGQVSGRLGISSATNTLWLTTKQPETTNTTSTAAVEAVETNPRRTVVDHSVLPTAFAMGTWTSKYTAEDYPSSGSETDDIPEESISPPAHEISRVVTDIHAETPPRQINASSENQIPSASTPWSGNDNPSALAFEIAPTSKPSTKTSSGEASTSATLKAASAFLLASEPTTRGLRSVTTNIAGQPAVTTPGAWTISARYGANNSVPMLDSLSVGKSTNANPRETVRNTHHTTLGTPVAGTWTTKPVSGSGTSSSSESTLKQTPISNTPSLLKPTPSSGTNTGSSSPSSTQISDLVNQLSPVTSHSISTRVPISGHPSTPAPVRPVLRTTPPPLSISSTSPDTDSLLTPSSLNSPRLTITLPQLQPVSTVTSTSVPQPPEKESAPRKNAFFDFFRPRPSLKTYEVWTPSTKSGGREERLKAPAPSPPKPKTTAPLPAPVPPRPRSPKFFSPFKLFSRRHRTVSSASLDVLDGTTPNTVMNSPASSMRADTPGAPPSPPVRDAILATQEWRNKEATDLVVSGRKRRHRPGVTFDCPEDVAPVDILPSRLRLGRMPNDDNDDD